MWAVNRSANVTWSGVVSQGGEGGGGGGGQGQRGKCIVAFCGVVKDGCKLTSDTEWTQRTRQSCHRKVGMAGFKFYLKTKYMNKNVL